MLKRFVDYLVGTASATKLFGSTSTFHRQSNWCWDVEPRPFITGDIYDYLVIDAKPIKGDTCAIVRSRDYVRVGTRRLGGLPALAADPLSSASTGRYGL